MARRNLYASSLSEANCEIRVLNLRAGSWDSPIVCDLAVKSMHETPLYNALSYVWGDEAFTLGIRVDGVDVAVTTNLESALRHIRTEERDHVLWVDALCINQEDTQERNQQVRMMGGIYAAASRVLIWIGEADDRSDTTFDLMSEVSHGRLDQIVTTKMSSFYFNLENRPWFKRVWIIQELALATQDPIVLCGRKSTPWMTFMSAWKTISRALFKELGMVRHGTGGDTNNTGESTEILARIKVDVLDNIRRSLIEQKGETFRQLYIFSRTSEAREPRDRVYGLFGMLTSKDRNEFKIEYEKPVWTVFTGAMAHIFGQGEGPAFLSSMWLHAGVSAISSLPTWVLDFATQTAEKASHPGNISFIPLSPQSVSGAGAGANNGRICEDMKTLRVEALIVDTVVETIVFDSTVDGCIQQLGIVEQLRAKVCSQTPVDVALRLCYEKYRISEPLWHLLVSGKRHNSGYNSAPAYYPEAYAHILEWGERSDRNNQQNSRNEDRVIEEYRDALAAHLPGRAFFATKNGLVGIGGCNVRADDIVTIWFGASIPFVLRPCGTSIEPRYSLMSGAYVGGIMNGEMVDELYCEDLVDSETLFVI